jgi:hypothetical protein
MIKSLRRFALLKRRAAHCDAKYAIRDLWAYKQTEEYPGTELPADFPFRDELVARWYFALEDIDGADECELQEQGFSSGQAAEILAETALLLQ